MIEELAPNADQVCNICGEKITHICLMSPDWSAKFSFEGILPLLREHMLKKHNIQPPGEYK